MAAGDQGFRINHVGIDFAGENGVDIPDETLVRVYTVGISFAGDNGEGRPDWECERPHFREDEEYIHKKTFRRAFLAVGRALLAMRRGKSANPEWEQSMERAIQILGGAVERDQPGGERSIAPEDGLSRSLRRQ